MAKVVNGMTVPQLSENANYDNWCVQMKVLLRSQDVWDMVKIGYEEPGESENLTVAQIAALKKSRMKDGSALYFLFNAVDESGFEKIVNAMTAKEAWEILEVAYKGDTRVRQVRVQALRREFEHLEMEENEGVTQFITRVQKVANQLGMNGEEMPPNRVAEKILRSLTDDFESIVVTIEETKDLTTLTVDELAGSLKAHELRKKKKKTHPSDQALQIQFESNRTRNTQSRGRGSRGRGRYDRGNVEDDSEEQTGQQNWHDRGQGNDRGGRLNYGVECFRCGKHGHYANECKTIKCFNCGKSGHIERYCRVEKKKEETNLLTEEAGEEIGILLMTRSDDAALPRRSPDVALRSWRSDAELHLDYEESWRPDSPERYLVNLYSSEKHTEGVLENSVELFESSDDEVESPKSPSEQERSSDYVSVEKFQEVLAELDRERQARFAAENSMSELQVSLNQLKMLNQEAIKKDDEFDCLGDDIFHENDEMLKEPEEIKKKDVLQLKIGNSSHMIVTGKEKILKKGKHENEDVEMNLITKKMILKNQEDPTIDKSNKFCVGYMKQKRDKG
ncbi:uncharacterized protein LOC124844900 [Vigna umbellata]|uniref:uncharacterized protein LOC124844900 n=1 Tax=Vigna umbellata TaxID=87088 RepID=UPI001F5F3319|nr:uncharacterized protein LOC124844900 [Vigna umbellata]